MKDEYTRNGHRSKTVKAGYVVGAVFFLILLLFVIPLAWKVHDWWTGKLNPETSVTRLVKKVNEDLQRIEKENPDWRVDEADLEITFSEKISSEGGTEKDSLVASKHGNERENSHRLLLKLRRKEQSSTTKVPTAKEQKTQPRP